MAVSRNMIKAKLYILIFTMSLAFIGSEEVEAGKSEPEPAKPGPAQSSEPEVASLAEPAAEPSAVPMAGPDNSDANSRPEPESAPEKGTTAEVDSDSSTQPNTEAEPEPNTSNDPNSEREPIARPESEPEAESEAEASLPEPELEPRAEAAPEPESEATAQPQAKPRALLGMEAEPELQSSSDPLPEREPSSESEPDTAAEAELSAMNEAVSEPETEPEAEAEAELGSSSEPFPEGEPGSEFERCAFLTAFFVILFGIVLLNGAILWAIVSSKAARGQTENRFLVSVLLASICVGVLVVPAHIEARLSETALPVWLCKLCEYAAHVSLAASILSQSALAASRFSTHVLNRAVSARATSVTIASLWLLALVYAVRAPLTHTIYAMEVRDREGNLFTKVRTCSAEREGSQLYWLYKAVLGADFVVLFLLPSLVVALGYLLVVRKLAARQQKGEKEEEGIRIFLALFILFLLCQTPKRIFDVLDHMTSVHLGLQAPLIASTLTIVSMSNAVLNPVAVLVFRKRMRRGIVDALLCRPGPKEPDGLGRLRPPPHTASSSFPSTVSTF